MIVINGCRSDRSTGIASEHLDPPNPTTSERLDQLIPQFLSAQCSGGAVHLWGVHNQILRQAVAQSSGNTGAGEMSTLPEKSSVAELARRIFWTEFCTPRMELLVKLIHDDNVEKLPDPKDAVEALGERVSRMADKDVVAMLGEGAGIPRIGSKVARRYVGGQPPSKVSSVDEQERQFLLQVSTVPCVSLRPPFGP
eukprot:evm.model.scf_629EXC.3 EVM.evm.TU.scf_629EXC.3   scf_629EXC:22845-23432(-)